MKSLAALRDRLAKLAGAIPKSDDGLFHGTSEQAIQEVQRLLAEVEIGPDGSPGRELTAEELAFCERAEKLTAEALARECRP